MFHARFYIKSLNPKFQNPKVYSQISRLSKHASKKPSITGPANEFIPDAAQESQCPERSLSSTFLPLENNGFLANIKISHPWREWVNLMNELLKNGYFEATGNPFAENGELCNKGVNLIRSACLNFARDHHSLIRYLSRECILVVAGTGCPSTDRKVVNSGKVLRAYVGSNEENVCGSCILRGDCDRAYVKAREHEGVQTVDVMRLLLTYGLDPIVDSVENKPCLNKRVEKSVRKLLKEMVDTTRCQENDLKPTRGNENGTGRIHIEASKKRGNWICPNCDSLNFTSYVKCLCCGNLSRERLEKLAAEMQHLPLKKGDWMCDTCKFLNFARNTRCLMCMEKPPKRQLNPGEWECESCNYINFRRNMKCLKCDHKRPIASTATEISAEHLGNPVNNHQTHPWFGQDKQTRDGGSQKTFEFVKNDAQDRSSLSSWNKMPCFVDFPVVGGKSDISCNIQKQELWRKRMANKLRTGARSAGDNTKIFKSISDERNEYLESGGGGGGGGGDGDDDEMAVWFGGGKKTHQ